MPRRLEVLDAPVRLTHDGSELSARAGEPLLLSLLAEKGFVLSRSPKLHRPRGPYCLRGACEGCLVRVDGVPNLMACQTRAAEGQVVETQNVIGTRELDVLGATDYLFPRGMDHHRLFAGVRGVSSLVQAFARRVSGLGQLAERPAPTRPGARRQVEVLVVGGGAAGLSAAAELGPRGLLADDQLDLGGALSALAPARAAALIERARSSGCELRAHTSVIGLYDEAGDGSLTAILIGSEGATSVTAERIVLSPGSHDPVLLFENNDLPGVLSARAALSLLRQGVLVGEQIAVVGEGRFAARFMEESAELAKCIALDPEMLVSANGRPSLTSVTVSAAGVERRHRVDAVIVDGPRPPAFELAVQAGGVTRFDPERGYVLEVDDTGRIAERVYAAGSSIGSRNSEEDGARAARAALASL
jgi:sarcosine oxidase subunit alpha